LKELKQKKKVMRFIQQVLENLEKIKENIGKIRKVEKNQRKKK